MEFKGTKEKWEKFISKKNKICVKIGNITLQLGSIYDDECDLPYCCKSEEHANALLISKAPEMLQSLQDVIRLRDLIDYDESIVNESNIGEASALHQMLNRIDLLIKEATEL